MFKLNIGVGATVMRLYYLPHNNKSYLIDIMEQHRIILSENIIEYYISEADDLYKDCIATYIDSIANVEDTHIFYCSSDNTSVKEELLGYVKDNQMRVLLSEKEEFEECSLKKINLITPDQLLNKEKNPLYLYSFPLCNYVAEIGDNCASYSAWFGHLFENENVIDILDRYILSDYGIKCLKKYYFPRIKKGSIVNIYCEIESNEKEEHIKNVLSESFFQDWDIHVFKCTGMHDRFIQISDIQISIGAGLDFLNMSGSLTKNCTINITRNSKGIPMPEIDYCVK